MKSKSNWQSAAKLPKIISWKKVQRLDGSGLE